MKEPLWTPFVETGKTQEEVDADIRKTVADIPNLEIVKECTAENGSTIFAIRKLEDDNE